MVEIGSLFVITQSDSDPTFQRLQGKVICLLRSESDLGKPADLCTVSEAAEVAVLLSVSDDRWVASPPLDEERVNGSCV